MHETIGFREEAATKIVVNVGCGPKGGARLPGFFAGWREVRVDVDPAVTPDILAHLTDLSAIESGSVDAVWASHCIEHLYLHEVGRAINEVYRILTDTGIFCVLVPDFQAIGEFIATDRVHEVVYEAPVGAVTAHDIVFGYTPFLERGRLSMAHKCGFTPTLLGKKLQEAPFAEIILQRRANLELRALACKTAPANEAERNALLAAIDH